jgi:hypothetical protein
MMRYFFLFALLLCSALPAQAQQDIPPASDEAPQLEVNDFYPSDNPEPLEETTPPQENTVTDTVIEEETLPAEAPVETIPQDENTMPEQDALSVDEPVVTDDTSETPTEEQGVFPPEEFDLMNQPQEGVEGEEGTPPPLPSDEAEPQLLTPEPVQIAPQPEDEAAPAAEIAPENGQTSTETNTQTNPAVDEEEVAPIERPKEIHEDTEGYKKKAILQGLNKITARTFPLEVKVGSSTRFDVLEVDVKKCWKAPPEERPENKALLEIWEQKAGEERKRIFYGWMFSSSPGLSSLEHPVYDITVVECE